MADPAPLRALQRAFAAHLRDPANQPPPQGIEARRLKIYRELFYNNVQDFLANAFPVLRRLLDEQAWHARVRHFYAHHRARAPQLYALAEEFVEYLAGGTGAQADDPPFLAELAHYEWVELALSIDEDEVDQVAADAVGDLLQGIPMLSPLVWPLTYTWPVHRICPDFRPRVPPAHASCLLVYRNRADEVRFMEANAVTLRLVELIESDPAPGLSLLNRIAVELQHPRPHAVVAAGARLLNELRDREIVLGTRRPD